MNLEKGAKLVGVYIICYPQIRGATKKNHRYVFIRLIKLNYSGVNLRRSPWKKKLCLIYIFKQSVPRTFRASKVGKKTIRRRGTQSLPLTFTRSNLEESWNAKGVKISRFAITVKWPKE